MDLLDELCLLINFFHLISIILLLKIRPSLFGFRPLFLLMLEINFKAMFANTLTIIYTDVKINIENNIKQVFQSTL